MRRLPALGIAAAAAIFLVDQAIKWMVTGPLDLTYEGDTKTLLPIFSLQFVKNRGVSLGLLTADSEAMRWGLVALTAAIAAGVLVWMTREANKFDRIALGAILGGAIGNILDRVRLGYVVDYADLHFGAWRPFLVFNLADAAITLGVLVLVLRAFLVRAPKPAAKEI